MKHRILTDSFSREFRLLRNRVEAEMQAPCIVLVTSATSGDGASITAFGLAESLSRTHQSTVFVTSASHVFAPELVGPSADGPRRRASDRITADAPKHGGCLNVIAISHERLATISRADATSMVHELRGAHDYVVIDGHDLPNNGFAQLLVPSADAVVVTFLTGRQQSGCDKVMLDVLERSEARILGIAMTDAAFIEHEKPAGSADRIAAAVSEKPQRNALARGASFAQSLIGKSS